MPPLAVLCSDLESQAVPSSFPGQGQYHRQIGLYQAFPHGGGLPLMKCLDIFQNLLHQLLAADPLCLVRTPAAFQSQNYLHNRR